MSHVVRLLRYPLKSALGEHLEAVEVDDGGFRGDRAWACVDAADGTVGSAKHPRRWGRLLEVEATLADAGKNDGLAVALDVAGTMVLAGSERADAVLSAHLGRAVRLTRDVPEGALLHRLLPDHPGLVPEWLAGLTPGRELLTKVTGARPGGRFVDYGAVHVVTTGALADLARRLGRPDVPAVRFRPNLVIDAPVDPVPGQELHLGDVVLRTLVPTPRCIVPALRHDPEPADPTVLTSLARHYRIELPGLGRAACFGMYAEVLQPGHIHVGQPVR